MRDSIKKSLDDSPVAGFERYPAGSIVLCRACALPIYKLDQGFGVGQRAGRASSFFKPVGLLDLVELSGRSDIDAGIRAKLASWTPDDRRAHVASLSEPNSGDPMICPICRDCFVQVLTVEKTETLDQAYVIELLTIPPVGVGKPAPVRGRHVGVHGEWVH